MRKAVVTLSALILTLTAVDAMASPSARRNPGMVWSAEAGGVILFGGLSPADISQLRYGYADTWRFTGTRWVRLYPENAPSPRYAASLTYDSARGRVVLFGGGEEDEVLGDTWVFTDGDWTNLNVPSAPPARRLAGFAYDPARDKAVLFGGGTVSANFYDTWEFDGTTWSLVSAEGPHVNLPTLVYDGARSEIVMVGTEGAEVVMYRYVDGSWNRVEPETMPPCAGQARMVFREFDGTVLLYGGSCPPGGVSNDTWIWNGTDWAEMTLARSAGSIFAHGMAHDPTRNRTVIFGGTSLEDTGRTFILSGDRWVQVTRNEEPGARTHFVFEPSPNGEHLLLFAGQNSTDFLSDLWRLNGLQWERVIPEGLPSSCLLPMGELDPQRNKLVILCSDRKTYEFDGEKFELKESTDAPLSRNWAMMAWDPVSRKVIQYGGLFTTGNYTDETWAWDGSKWKEVEIRGRERPPARMLATMFVDPTTNRIVMAGGLGRPSFNSDFERYEDQWQFDGAKWVEMTPARKLPQRYGAQVAVDPVNQRVYVFGGKSSTEEYLNDMWVWNGSTWSEVDDGPAPSPRMNGRLAWDPLTGKLVLYGGYAGLYYPELWTFDGSWTRVEPGSSFPRRPVRRPSAGSGDATHGEEASSTKLVTPTDVSPPRRVTLPDETLR